MLTNLKTKIIHQPFNLLLMTAILLVIFSFLPWGQSFDIHLHDTYFIISTVYFIWALSIIFFLTWTIYKWISKILWKRFLTWFHVLVTIFILIALLTANFWFDTIFPQLKRDFSSFNTFQADRNRQAKVILPLVFLFLAGQLAFVVNIIGGLTSKVWKR